VKIIWSVASEKSYLTIIEQLFEKWGISFVEKFEYQVNQLLHNIINHNHICPKSYILELHKCVVNKHISLIYRVSKKGNIEIVLLIFNKSEHIF
jgi:plasmid stabilization system protein ParE